MKRLFPVLLAASLAVVAHPVQAEDTKVVVVPLAADSGGPGDWKHVSVSSLGGIPRNSATRTGVLGSSADYACGDIGRYAEDGGFEYLTVPIQLPDGATIIGFTGLISLQRNLFLETFQFHLLSPVRKVRPMVSLLGPSNKPDHHFNIKGPHRQDCS